ncbi:MAG: hypothetical protein KAS60_06065 [Thermoplasmata archaeon]|nr:hypothetical protein [Thermoplasmata archaeon]
MTSASASIAAIEKKYVVELPSSYKKLVSDATLEATHSDDWEPVIGNCWFNGLRGMLDKNPRYAEMLTGVFPFAHENGDKFCFFFGRTTADLEPPIVIHLFETMDLFPIASSLRGLMWYEFAVEEISVMGYYESDSHTRAEKETSLEKIRATSKALDIPYEFGPKPSMDRKEDWLDFHREFLKVDPMAAQSLCWVGRWHSKKGDTQEAAKYFERSSQAAPHFAAPYHFLSKLKSVEDKEKEALKLRWQMVSCPLCMSGYTYWMCFNLGVDSAADASPRNPIVSRAFAALRENESGLFEIVDGDPLAEYIRNHEPADLGGRMDLAQEYQRSNQLEKAAREWNNVLYLSWYAKGAGALIALKSLSGIYRLLGRDSAVAMHQAPSLQDFM